MTDADREKWERVATRIGVWKLGLKCPGCLDPDGHRFTGVEDGEPIGETHEIPCPDPSNPVMIVAMLEWILINAPDEESWMTPLMNFGRGATTDLAAALIDAIDALPED